LAKLSQAARVPMSILYVVQLSHIIIVLVQVAATMIGRVLVQYLRKKVLTPLYTVEGYYELVLVAHFFDNEKQQFQGHYRTSY
jgi:hypothetical protein